MVVVLEGCSVCGTKFELAYSKEIWITPCATACGCFPFFDRGEGPKKALESSVARGSCTALSFRDWLGERATPKMLKAADRGGRELAALAPLFGMTKKNS